jgi:putative transposase
MHNELLKHRRKSNIEFGTIVFWTATINNWIPLLQNNKYKDVLINTLDSLNTKGKIDVYSFVIMPNHIHLIWKIKEMNGKESPPSSFLKFTAHEFKKMLIIDDDLNLAMFSVKAKNKKFEFWQRDSLAIKIYSPEMAFQKMEYIHNNPLAKNWNLADEPLNYQYSSAKFYETGNKNYPFLKDIRDEF